MIIHLVRNYLIFLLPLAHLGPLAAQSLTVEYALTVPSLERIEKAYVTRGGSYTQAIGQQIQLLIHEILKGSFTQQRGRKKDSTETIVHVDGEGDRSVYSLAKLASSITSSVRLPASSLSYAHLAKGLVDVCQKVYVSIEMQKRTISLQDDELASDILLRTAHHFAVHAVVQLLYIIYSSYAHPCERMHALYLLNTVELLGSRGALFQRFRARMNRFYFTPEGMIRSYDPSELSGHSAKHVKALADFLNGISAHQNQALLYLSRGVTAGIPLLVSFCDQIKQQGWSRSRIKFGWRFAAALFKEITTIDVIDMRTVEPQKIFTHKANRDFLALMLLCLRAQTESEVRDKVLSEAEDLCAFYKTEPGAYYGIMKRYYHSSCDKVRYHIES